MIPFLWVSDFVQNSSAQPFKVLLALLVYCFNNVQPVSYCLITRGKFGFAKIGIGEVLRIGS